MKRTHFVTLFIVGLAAGIALLLWAWPREEGDQDWLKMISEPTLQVQSNAVPRVSFAVSNAGPRHLVFRVDDLGWISRQIELVYPDLEDGPLETLQGDAAEEARQRLEASYGTWSVASNTPTRMRSGEAKEITLQVHGRLPNDEDCAVVWTLTWWELPSALRQWLDSAERCLPFSLWRSSALAGSQVLSSQRVPIDLLMASRYGLFLFKFPEPSTGHTNAANGKPPRLFEPEVMVTETNRKATAGREGEAPRSP